MFTKYDKAGAAGIVALAMLFMSPEIAQNVAAYMGLNMPLDVAVWVDGALKTLLTGGVVFAVPNKK